MHRSPTRIPALLVWAITPSVLDGVMDEHLRADQRHGR